MIGCGIRYSEISDGTPKTRLITPAGMPASTIGAHQRDAAAGRFFRPFEDHRAAGGERGRDLAHRLVDREIPRRERGDGADRLLDDELMHVPARAGMTRP